MLGLNPPHLHLRRDLFHVEEITRPAPEKRPRRHKRVIAVLPAYNAEKTLAAWKNARPSAEPNHSTSSFR